MTDVHVVLGPRSYDIHITSSDISGIGPFARQRARGEKALVVADDNVRGHASAVSDALSAAGLRAELATMPPGEGQKSLARASLLYDRLLDLEADRRTLVVAVGGGVVGDLAGFVAATWNRGVPLLMVPTTLLAMVDSSVGGKVGVNHPRGKNLIGAFHQPIGVWIDTDLLDTLPRREYLSGLAEVVKYGVALDPDFFAWLTTHADAIRDREPEKVRLIVARCCRLKADVVEQDEREESGVRAVLNYGHTFAHAFETVAGYGTWLHGEAVAAGMCCAATLANQRGRIPTELVREQRRLLELFSLPTFPNRSWSAEALLAVMRRDKKNVGGRLRFVLPERLGAAGLVEGVTEQEVRQALASV
jgi:3-dehydroquinate synthase